MATIDDIIQLAIAFDENYLTPFYVLITSVFLNMKGSNITIHVIATGVSQTEKNKITEYVYKHNSNICFYEIENRDLSAFVVPQNMYFTIAAYYRIFFPLIVPGSINKLLYIDTDTIVLKDLSDLYYRSVDFYPVAAVKDTGARIRPDLNIYNKDDYFNSGVLLINIPEWKAQNISEKAIDFINKNPEKLAAVDQDALNAVLNHNWQRLDQYHNITYLAIPKDLPPKQYKPFLNNVTIIHYTGGDKPWQGLGKNKFRYLYHYYLKKSPRFFEKKYSDFKLSKAYIIKFIKIRLREIRLNF